MQTWLLALQCCIFLLLNILDGHSTWLVVRPDHYERERNPIARWVFRKLRLPRAIPLFKAFLLLMLALVIWYWQSDKATLNIALSIGNVLFVIVVWHNYKVHKLISKRSRNIIHHSGNHYRYIHRNPSPTSDDSNAQVGTNSSLTNSPKWESSSSPIPNYDTTTSPGEPL
jgi:hypothetical protein